MLNVATVGSATVFLESLLASGKTLEPVKNTPLSELTQCCLHVLRDERTLGKGDETMNLESICYDIVDMSNMFNGKIQTASDHDVYLDRATKLAGEVIQRNLNITRNHVQPMVRDLVERVEVALQDFSNVTFQTPILTDKVLDVFTHPLIEDMVKEAAASAYYADFPFINSFPALAAESIRELIPSMNSELDKRVEEVIEAIGASRLIELYSDAFVTGELTIKKCMRNEYILLFLMLNNLLTTKPAGVNAKVEEFYDKLHDMRKQAALRIRNDLQRWREGYESNSLIIAYPPSITADKTTTSDPIIVHDELYTEWLTAGGEPDLIYGAFFSDRPLNGQAILTERGKYQYEALQYLSQVQAANESKRSSVIRRTLRAGLTELFEAEVAKGESGLNETHRDAFNEKLNNATTLDLNDTLGFTTILVCDSLYPETYAKKIIDGINTYQRHYPTSRVEDLVTLVITDLLVEWVVNLMYIKPLGAS